MHIKVLHLRSSNFYGGPERQIHFHAKRAIQTGIDLKVSSFSEKSCKPEFLKIIANENIPIKLFSVKSAYDPSSAALIKKYLKDHDIDILCTHDYRSHYYGYRACRGLSTKWVAFSRGMTTENIKIKVFMFLT